MDPEGFVTKSEIAAALKASTRTVDRYVRKGLIRPYKREGLVRFKLSEVLGWFASGEANEPVQPARQHEQGVRPPCGRKSKGSRKGEVDLAVYGRAETPW